MEVSARQSRPSFHANQAVDGSPAARLGRAARNARSKRSALDTRIWHAREMRSISRER